MKFTFKHRRTIAKITLVTVFIVLLLAFTFTVFGAPRYDGSFQDNIMLTADDIGHSISSTGSRFENTCGSTGSGGILPVQNNFTDLSADNGFVLTALLFLLPLAAGFSFANSEHTPVSLRIRIDQ